MENEAAQQTLNYISCFPLQQQQKPELVSI